MKNFINSVKLLIALLLGTVGAIMVTNMMESVKITSLAVAVGMFYLSGYLVGNVRK